jgi:peptide/nickel transport system substrate-binding protein
MTRHVFEEQRGDVAMKIQRLLLVVALLVGLVGVACSSAQEAVTEDAITREELDSALKQAIAAAAQPAPAPAPAGPTAEELRGLVSEAVAGAVPEGTSAEEIASMVEAAVEAATAGAVTAADINRSVANAVEDAVSGGPTPLSSGEVEAIVSAAVAAIPAPEPIMIPAPAPAPPPVDIEMARMGGTLRAVPHGSLKSLDAQWTTVTVTANVRHHLQEGLFTLDDGLALQPQLAESWQSSPDGLTTTVKLRDGLKFHTGQDLKAGDLVGSFDKVKDVATLWKLVVTEFGGVISATDDRTLQIQVNEPTALVLDSLMTEQSFPPIAVPESAYSLPQTESAPEPIGTGPFKFESWSPGDRWTMVRYDDYNPSALPTSGLAGRHVAFADRVEWIEIADQAARLAALEVGEVDLLDFFSPTLADRVFSSEAVDPVVVMPGEQMGVYLNHLKPPFDNKNVRRALQLAYPMESALKLSVGGNDALWRLCPTYYTCGTRWENTVGTENYNTQDLEQARQLVKEAGFEGTTVRLMAAQDMPWFPQLSLVTREVLEDVGFVVDFQSMDWATLTTRRADPELWEAFHTGSGTTVTPLTKSTLTKNGWFNRYQDESGKMAELLAEFTRAKTAADQVELIGELQAQAFEDVPYVLIGEVARLFAAGKNVQGFKPAHYFLVFDVWLEE